MVRNFTSCLLCYKVVERKISLKDCFNELVLKPFPMNFLKRLFYACHKLCTSQLISILATIMGVFYFVVANDLFWNGQERWNSASMTILFNAPIFLFVAVVVASFIYFFMKKKVEQQAARVERELLQNASVDKSSTEDASDVAEEA